jgi:anionic cell wall polymer biosynthesis LytR-Cps2A-Psr (LCP) family protein
VPARPTQRPLTRRQVRLERRKRRQRIGAAGIAAIVVASLIVVAAVAFGVHKAVTHTTAAPKAGPSSVLLQIEGSSRTALGSVLLTHDPSATQKGVELLVPSRLITDVCGVGQVEFGQTLADPNGAAVSREAVSAALGGVTVDGSWVLSTTQLAKLVDDVGGVTVDVDTNVISHGAHGTETIVVPKGDDEHLTGSKAVEYATYTASSKEGAAAQLARLQLVVDAVIRALPRTTAGVSAKLSGLGAGGTSTLGAAKLSALLTGLASDDSVSGGVLPIDLPVDTIDAGGSPSYSVDTAKTAQLVDENLKALLPPTTSGPKVTVELRNGVGHPGLVATTCPRLAKAGLVYGGQGNAGSFDNPQSEVQIQSDSATDIADGDRVAKALGLPLSDVRRAQFGQDQVDVIVILGRDYKP